MLGPYHICPFLCPFCMKCSLVISYFLEEISSLSHSIVFLYFFALIMEEGFLILTLLAILWNSAFKWVYLSFSPVPFTFHFFSAICKASSDYHFAFLHFFLGDGLNHCLLYNVRNLHPWFFRHSIRNNV